MFSLIGILFILSNLLFTVKSSDFGYYVTSFLQENVVPGQPITYDTTLYQTSGLTTEFSNMNNNTGLNGTILTIATPGLYLLHLEMTWDIDGGLTVWAGPSIDNMTESTETVGSSGFYNLFTGVLVTVTPGSNYKVAVGACTCNLFAANMRSHFTTDSSKYTRPTLIIRSVP